LSYCRCGGCGDGGGWRRHLCEVLVALSRERIEKIHEKEAEVNGQEQEIVRSGKDTRDRKGTK
jgi:hypothetical protein